MLYSLLNVTPWYILWDWSGDCEEDGPRKSLQFSHSVLSDSLRPMNCNKPGFLIHHQLLELAQTHVRRIVMPSNHLILCRPFSSCPQSSPASESFSNESALHLRWPKYWSFSFSITPSNEYSGLISFRIDWLDLLAIQWTLKSLLQHHSLKASIFWRSAFLMAQFSHLYMTTGGTTEPGAEIGEMQL